MTGKEFFYEKALVADGPNGRQWEEMSPEAQEAWNRKAEIEFEGKDDYASIPDSCIACLHCGEFQYQNDLVAEYQPDTFHKIECMYCFKLMEFKWEIETLFTVREVKK